MNTKRALVVVTSVTKYPDMNRPTGLWFGEVVHFADVLYKMVIKYIILVQKVDILPLTSKFTRRYDDRFRLGILSE